MKLGTANGKARGREPSLQQWCGRREHEERHADRDREEFHDAENGIVLIRGNERTQNRDRRTGGNDGDLERDNHREEQGQVQPGLPADAEFRDTAMGVEVSAEERDLEEHQTSVPDAGRSPDERQQALPHVRLDQK